MVGIRFSWGPVGAESLQRPAACGRLHFPSSRCINRGQRTVGGLSLAPLESRFTSASRAPPVSSGNRLYAHRGYSLWAQRAGDGLCIDLLGEQMVFAMAGLVSGMPAVAANGELAVAARHRRLGIESISSGSHMERLYSGELDFFFTGRHYNKKRMEQVFILLRKTSGCVCLELKTVQISFRGL